MQKRILFLSVLMVLLMAAATAFAACEHDFYMANTSKPTCESDGYYILKCHLCGYTKKEITDTAWGHTWEFKAQEAATCDTKGYKQYICTTCDKIRTESIPATGHDWKDSKVLEEATCTKAGSMRTVCKVCGLSSTRKIEKSHKYGSWAVTEDATDHSTGTRTRTCKVCKKKQTESFYPEGTLYKNIKNKKTEVKDLQQKLTDLGYLNDKVDGIFGAKTEKAVKAFQKEHGLTVDGIAWPQTLAALDAAWNAEFGVPEDTYAPCCGFLDIDENGRQYWETCEVHTNIYLHAADELPANASEVEFAGAYAIAWQAELDRLYQLWLDNCAPEEQPMVINHKVMFMGYLNSQQMLWNMQYGEGSLDALERGNEMLMYQCYTLCGAVYPLMSEQ